MIDRLFELASRLNLLQQRTDFRIGATVVGLLLVGTIFLLGYTGRALWLPEAFNENLISSTVLAALIVAGLVWFNLAITAAVIFGVGIPTWIIFDAAGRDLWAQTALGVSTLVVIFLMMVRAAKVALSAPWPPLAVARLVLDEASRMKLALVFIVALIVFIPFLAAQLDPHERLQYRIQTFLSYGVGIAYGLLAIMTLFLSTATVAFEQRDKQIFQVVTKPVGRFQYLLGKWIGIMTLNLILLAMVGGSIFWFTQYLRSQPAHDQFDALAVSEQVLTARVGVEPVMPDFRERALHLAQEELRHDPERRADPRALERLVSEKLSILQGELFSIGPGHGREYLFENVFPVSRSRRAIVDFDNPVVLPSGVKSPIDVRVMNEDGSIIYSQGGQYALEPARHETRIHFAPERIQQQHEHPLRAGQRVVVRYFPENALTLRIKIGGGAMEPGTYFPMTFIPQGGAPIVQNIALIQTQTVMIPAGFVGDDGTLRIAIVNGDVHTGEATDITASFAEEGLELMYKVSSFESNYARAMVVIWLKLGFLAMLGIAAATFASFPVACLLAFTIFLGAEATPFMSEALRFYYVTDGHTGTFQVHRAIIYGIAISAHWLLEAYGNMRPTAFLIEGRVISWSAVLQTLVVISFIWSGLAGLLGYVIFRQRQLAIYSGHA